MLTRIGRARGRGGNWRSCASCTRGASIARRGTATPRSARLRPPHCASWEPPTATRLRSIRRSAAAPCRASRPRAIRDEPPAAGIVPWGSARHPFCRPQMQPLTCRASPTIKGVQPLSLCVPRTPLSRASHARGQPPLCSATLSQSPGGENWRRKSGVAEMRHGGGSVRTSFFSPSRRRTRYPAA